MEPIANETWRSFQRSYYRARLLLLLASLGEAYVGQLARMLRLPHRRVRALLEGDEKQGYSPELALVPLGLAVQKPTVGKGRAYEITAKGRRKARSMTAGAARRAAAGRGEPGPAPTPGAVVEAARTAEVRWSVQVTGDRTPARTADGG